MENYPDVFIHLKQIRDFHNYIYLNILIFVLKYKLDNQTNTVDDISEHNMAGEQFHTSYVLQT